MDLEEFLDMPFSLSHNLGICDKKISPSAYKYSGITQLCFGAEQDWSSTEEAIPDAIVKEIHIYCKNTSPELCSDDASRKQKITYKRRHLQEITSDEITIRYLQPLS